MSPISFVNHQVKIPFSPLLAGKLLIKQERPQFDRRRDRSAAFARMRGAILFHHRQTAPPQVMPAPIAIMAITSPFLSLPARLASSSVIGIEALEVLP